MKKEINSKSRRKWIMGGLAAFASVALLTTGFAVWVVGVTQDKNNHDVGVSVATSSNANVTFEAKLVDDESIYLDEKKPVDTTKFVNTGATDVKGDLSITFTSMTIKYGLGAADLFDTSKGGYKEVAFSINNFEESETGEVGKYKNVIVSKDSNKIGTGAREANESGWTYITAPVSIPLTKFEKTVDSITNAVTLTLKDADKAMEFTWGTFFGGVSPCTYYNNLVDTGKIAKTVENADLINAEITQMYDALDNGKIRLTASLAK